MPYKLVMIDIYFSAIIVCPWGAAGAAASNEQGKVSVWRSALVHIATVIDIGT